MFSTSFATSYLPRLPQKLAGVVTPAVVVGVIVASLALAGCAQRPKAIGVMLERDNLPQPPAEAGAGDTAELNASLVARLREQLANLAPTTTPTTLPASDTAQLAAAPQQRDDATGAALVRIIREELAAFRSAATRFAQALPTTTTPNTTAPAPDSAPVEPPDAQPALSLPVIALCTEVSRFGTYEPLSTRFDAGKRHKTLLYVEVDRFDAQRAPDGWWETKMLFSAVLTDAGGKQVHSVPESPVIDRSRQRRRDFFVCCDLTLPGSLRPGRYVLAVTVADSLGGGVAQQTLELEVVGKQ